MPTISKLYYDDQNEYNKLVLQWVEKYAHEIMGCTIDHHTCINAVSNLGNLSCLKYLHRCNCAWNKETCTTAIINKRNDCLIYAIQNNCPLDENAHNIASEYDNLQAYEYIIK